MPSSSRIILAEHLGECEPFAIGRLQADDGARPVRASRPSTRPEDPQDAQRKAAFEEGFRRGANDAGRRLAQKRAAEEAALGGALAIRLEAMTERFAREMDALEHATAERVATLAVELARRVVGDTLSTQPGAIVAVAREALAALVETSATPTLRLNPADLEPVQAQLAPALERRRIELQADPSISPGGCLLVSAGGAVDATLETRWARTLASIGREPGEPPAVRPAAALAAFDTAVPADAGARLGPLTERLDDSRGGLPSQDPWAAAMAPDAERGARR